MSLPPELADYLQEDAAALTGVLVAAGKPLASHRLVDDRRFGEGLARCGKYGRPRSLLAVPLPVSSGRGVGLVLGSTRPKSVFDDSSSR